MAEHLLSTEKDEAPGIAQTSIPGPVHSDQFDPQVRHHRNPSVSTNQSLWPLQARPCYLCTFTGLVLEHHDLGHWKPCPKQVDWSPTPAASLVMSPEVQACSIGKVMFLNPITLSLRWALLWMNSSTFFQGSPAPRTPMTQMRESKIGARLNFKKVKPHPFCLDTCLPISCPSPPNQ